MSPTKLIVHQLYRVNAWQIISVVVMVPAYRQHGNVMIPPIALTAPMRAIIVNHTNVMHSYVQHLADVFQRCSVVMVIKTVTQAVKMVTAFFIAFIAVVFSIEIFFFFFLCSFHT